jgi:hypothetical protein
MASGAGINTVGNLGGLPLLTISPTASAITNPTIAYGTNTGAPGVPGTATYGNDSGVVMVEAKGFTKWTFQIIGQGKALHGYTVSIYGTTDPALLRQAYQTAGNTVGQMGQQPDQMNSLTAIPATSWDLLPMQASTGGATEGNPLVSGTNTIGMYSGAMVAVRVVLTSISSPVPDYPITVLGFAVP